MLSHRHRILLAISALLLTAVFIMPLWKISLIAPQYPEGIGMLIRVNAVTGVESHHLENINGLNHYIGMKRIEPDAIPELKLMPPVMLLLIVTGLVSAALGKRSIARIWVAVFLLGSIAGMADFWLWQYDYGHNLDFENAPIKVPGMTYQPPLLGSKKLLNFTATSWPAGGGIAAFASLFLAIGVIFSDWKKKSSVSPNMAKYAVPLLLVSLIGCGEVGPRAFIEDVDTCNYCRMSISDLRFGTQAISEKGKIETFDSLECLAGYVNGLPSDAQPKSIWVTDFESPGTFIDAKTAVYIIDGTIESPMGRRLSAFPQDSDTDRLVSAYGGRIATWNDVLHQVDEFDASHELSHHGHDH